MRHFGTPFALAAFALTAACGGPSGAPKADEAVRAALEAPSAMVSKSNAGAITAEDLARHISTLASDAFEGRAPTTPGGEKTRAYIAAEYERIGLDPIGDSFFQDVPMVETTLDPAQSFLRFDLKGETRDIAYKSEAVWGTKRVRPEVSFEASDVVFVGYGVVAPEHQWNDYAGVDVRGKTVLVLINDPGFLTNDDSLFGGKAMTYYGRWTYKYEEAARQGAAAAIIIHDTKPAAYGWNVVEGSWSGAQIDLQRADDGMSRAVLEGWIQQDVARAVLNAAGVNLDEATAAANKRGFRAMPLDGVKASAKITQAIKRSSDANVIGVLKGAEAPEEYFIYMGHWDHLGVDPTAEGEDKIYNGAVDNATGIAAIIEIAEKFAAGPRPRRSIIFAAVTAEESGLLGSAFMAENPPVALKDIVGGINIDAILPTPPSKDIIVVGHGASELEDVLTKHAEAAGKYIRPDQEPEKGYFYRSDHISFAKKGVPMLYADSGSDLVEGGEAVGRAMGDQYTSVRYHQPADEYAPDWVMTGMVESTTLLHAVGADIASSTAWPNWRAGNEFRALRDAQRAGG
jgi:Zn-dependent M28 family amino/carboxypeptidase